MKAIHKSVIHYKRERYFWIFVIWAFAAIAASAAAAYFSLPDWIYWAASVWLLLLFLTGILLRPSVYSRVTRYELKEDLLIVRVGFFRVSTKMVPIKRIQGVTLSTGPISKKYGLANLMIRTASTGLVLPPLEMEEADMLKRDIIELVKGESTDV